MFEATPRLEELHKARLFALGIPAGLDAAKEPPKNHIGCIHLRSGKLFPECGRMSTGCEGKSRIKLAQAIFIRKPNPISKTSKAFVVQDRGT